MDLCLNGNNNKSGSSRRRSSLFLIMSFTLDDLNRVVRDPVNDAIPIVDSTAPEAAHVLFQRLRLADSVVSVALDVLQELVDPLQGLLVLGLPVQVVLPRVLGK